MFQVLALSFPRFVCTTLTKHCHSNSLFFVCFIADKRQTCVLVALIVILIVIVILFVAI